MSHSPPLHTCGSGRWRAARCRTPSAELWSSAAGRIWGDRNIIIIFNKQNNTQVMWCSGEQVSRCEVVTGRLWGSAGSSAGSSDAVWWRESAQLDLQTSPRYWRKIRFELFMILICWLLKYDINKVIRRREHSTMKTVLVILITFRWLRRNWRLSSHLYICNNDVTSSERLILIKQVNWSQKLMKTFKENSSSIKLQMIGVIFSL